MEQESLVLGIDLGTTSVKVAVVDAISRQCVHRSIADTSAVLQSPSVKRSKEQDVTMIFATLDSLVSSVPVHHKEKIRMVSVCGQMHGCVLWGSNNNNINEPAESTESRGVAASERQSADGEQAADSGATATAGAAESDPEKSDKPSTRLALPLSTPVSCVADTLLVATKNTSEGEATTPTASTALSPAASADASSSNGATASNAAAAASSLLAVSPLFQAMPRRVSTLVTWEDGRCDSAFLASLPTPRDGRLSTGFGCATLAWMERHARHDWLQPMRAAGTVMDLLVATLTSQLDSPLMSEQCAASWGFYDWDQRQWEMDKLRDTSFPCRFLPRTGPAASVAGQLQWTWHGIRTGTPITIASGDMQCGVYGAMHRKTQAVLNIGTSAQVACILPKGHQLPSASSSSSSSSSSTANNGSSRPTGNNNNSKGKSPEASSTGAAATNTTSTTAASPMAAAMTNGDGNTSSSSEEGPSTAKLALTSAATSATPSPAACTRGDTTQCKCQSGKQDSATTTSSTTSPATTAGTSGSSGDSGSAVASVDITSRLSKLKLNSTAPTPSSAAESSAADSTSATTSITSAAASSQECEAVSAAAAIPPLECWPFFFNQRLAVAASLNGGNVLMSFVEMLQAWVAELCAVAPHTDDVFAHLITAGQRRIREGASARGDVIVVPRFFGERHRPQSRASVRELSPTSTSLGGIFTALCRGLVKNLNEMMPVSFLKECHVDCLVGTGTALLRNGVLQAAVVESYGMRVEAVPIDDATVGAAYGAALVAVDTLAGPSSASSATVASGVSAVKRK